MKTKKYRVCILVQEPAESATGFVTLRAKNAKEALKKR